LLCIHIDAFIFIALCHFGQNQNISKLILNCFEKALKKNKTKEKEKKLPRCFVARRPGFFPRSPAAQARFLLPSPSL